MRHAYAHAISLVFSVDQDGSHDGVGVGEGGPHRQTGSQTTQGLSI